MRLLGLVLLLGTAALPRPGSAAIAVEVYADRTMFESRLGASVQVVDFDDVTTTSPSDIVGFAADRYAVTKGVVITGKQGQYVSQTWTFPSDFGNPPSAPNSYAPGPMSTAQDAGGHETDVTFVSGVGSTAVAGFGCIFIDADYPQSGPSGLEIYDTSDAQLATEGPVSGPNGSKVFRGLVTVDDQTNQPVAAIARVRVVNGDEWPPRDVDEGVVLDDFVFGPIAGGTTTTTLPGGGCDVAPTFDSITCRLAALATAVGAATDLGRLKPGLGNTVQKARAKVAKAQGYVAASKAKQAKTQLKKAGKRLRSFAHKLASRSARKIVPEPTRTALAGAANLTAPDVASLAGSL